MPIFPTVIVALLLAAGAFASVRLKKLSPAAGITGTLLGILLYAGSGYVGLLLLALFFIGGTLATSWKKDQKLAIEGSAAHQPTRQPGQVLANGGIAAACSGLALIAPAYHSLFNLMMAGSLAAATSDTLSSELGMVYGRRFFNILTWKTDLKGRDGVISLEGLLFGVIGSALIGFAYTLKEQHILLLGLAGFIGNLFDSILGAALERKGFISNDGVNLLNTLTGALAAGTLFLFF